MVSTKFKIVAIIIVSAIFLGIFAMARYTTALNNKRLAARQQALTQIEGYIVDEKTIGSKAYMNVSAPMAFFIVPDEPTLKKMIGSQGEENMRVASITNNLLIQEVHLMLDSLHIPTTNAPMRYIKFAGVKPVFIDAMPDDGPAWNCFIYTPNKMPAIVDMTSITSADLRSYFGISDNLPVQGREEQ